MYAHNTDTGGAHSAHQDRPDYVSRTDFRSLDGFQHAGQEVDGIRYGYVQSNECTVSWWAEGAFCKKDLRRYALSAAGRTSFTHREMARSCVFRPCPTCWKLPLPSGGGAVREAGLSLREMNMYFPAVSQEP